MILKKHFRVIIFIVAILSIQLLFYYYGVSYSLIFKFIDAHPVSAPIIFIIATMVAMMGIIPTLPFNVGAGILFGGIYGGILSTMGATLGSIGAFVIARNLSKKYTDRYLDNKLMRWVNAELDSNGWRIVAMVRLCPGVPTGPLNYVFGLTNIPTFTYTWLSFLFMLPPNLVISMMGQHIGTYFLSDDNLNLFYLIMALMMGLTLLLFAIPIIFRRLFKMKTIEGALNNAK